jgi:hypothetical protein
VEPYLRSFDDDSLLTIVLNVDPENLKDLAASSPKFARFLNSKNVLSKLAEKYRVLNAESLAEFVENYKGPQMNVKRSEEVFEGLKKAILTRDESLYSMYIQNIQELRPKQIKELGLLAVDKNLLPVVKDMLNLMATQNIFYYQGSNGFHFRRFEKLDLINSMIEKARRSGLMGMVASLHGMKNAYMSNDHYNPITDTYSETEYTPLK